jgi:hypothetical protein
MCLKCNSLPKEGDLASQLKHRAKLLEDGRSRYTRLDYLPQSELLEKARKLSAQVQEQKLAALSSLKRLTTTRARIQSLKDKAKNSAVSGSVSKLIADLRHCDESGKPSKRHQAQKRTTGLDDKPDLRTVIRAPGKRHATKMIHF